MALSPSILKETKRLISDFIVIIYAKPDKRNFDIFK